MAPTRFNFTRTSLPSATGGPPYFFPVPLSSPAPFRRDFLSALKDNTDNENTGQAGSAADSTVSSTADGANKTTTMEGRQSQTPVGTTATPTTTAEQVANTNAMVPSSNNTDTIVVHTDSTIVYSCPTKTGAWTHSNRLVGGLTASEVDGPGCQLSFTFTGDSIQAYGATATNAGPYGCSVDSDPLLTDWWQAQGSSNWFSAYQGACRIAGIGYGKHVFTMINSPNDPGTLYFTGLHYTKNQSQQPWSQPIIEGCCREYDFPAGATTTISSGSESSVETGAGNSTTSGATTPAKSTNYVTIVTVALAALALTAIAALLVGCLCCRKTSDPPPPEDAFASALADEKEPLRKKKKKKHHVHKRKKSASSKRSSTSSASATDTASTGTDSDQRKSGGRRRRGKKSKKSDDDDDDATDTD